MPARPAAGSASAARTVATNTLIADRQSSAVRRLLFLTGAVVFVDTLFFAALTPLLPHYAASLGLSKGGAGVLAAAYPAGAFLGAIPSGLVAGRLGVKPTAIVGLTLVAACTILFGLADQAWQLDLARFAQGLACAFSWTGALGWLVAAAPAGNRGRLIGNAFATAVAGALFGPVIGGIASVAGTGWTFGAVGVASFGLVAWAALTPGDAGHEPQSPVHLMRALGDRRILVAAWFVLLPALLFGVVGVLAPLRLAQLGFGAVAIGAVFLCSAAFEAVNNVVLGRVSDRRGPLPPIFARARRLDRRRVAPPVAGQSLAPRGAGRRGGPVVRHVLHARDDAGLESRRIARSPVRLLLGPRQPRVGPRADAGRGRRWRAGPCDARRGALPRPRRRLRTYAARPMAMRTHRSA